MSKQERSRASLALVLALVLAGRALAQEGDWPQLQHDARHSGYTPANLKLPSRPDSPPRGWTPLAESWTADFLAFDPPEHLYRTVQTIAHAGRLLVPTMEGNLHALDPATGKPVWKFATGELICASAAGADGLAFVATVQGSVHAVNIATGKRAWKWHNGKRTGFTTAPVLAAGKLFLAGRAGDVYCIDPATGRKVWSRQMSAPILQTPAADAGRLFFAAEDMHLYCLSTADGKELWKSRKLAGMGFREYYPVIHDGKVLVEAEPGRMTVSALTAPFTTTVGGLGDGMPPLTWGTGKEFLDKHGKDIQAGKPSPEALSAMIACQEQQVKMFKAHPERMLRYCFDVDGQSEHILPLWMNTMCGPQAPPIVDRDGMWVMCVAFVQMGWGRMDPKTLRVVDVLYDHIGRGGRGNPDEDMVLSSAGNVIFASHAWGTSHAQYHGYFDLDTRRWDTYGAGDLGASRRGPPAAPAPEEKRPLNQRMLTGRYTNAQNELAGVSVAYGRAYFQTRHTVRAFEPRGEE